MTDDSDKAEELLQQSKSQKRHETDPSTSVVEESHSLEDAIVAAYEQLDDGELNPTLSVRDRDLAALMAGLEETGRLADVGDRANDSLGREAESTSKAAVLKALVRVGLMELGGEEIEAAKSAKKEHLVSQADDF